MIIVDPLGAVVKLWEMFRSSKRALAWARLLFSMLFSALISFLGTAGAALYTGDALLVGIGAGMMAAAAALLALFVASPLTRGMMVSVPKGVVEKLQDSDDQVKIERH